MRGMRDVVRLIILGQLFLYGGLAACVLIRPAGLGSNDGISYYGTFLSTVIFYGVGLLGSAVFCLLAAKKITDSKLKVIRLALLIYAPLTIGIVVTPYSAGAWFDYLHTAFGSALFSLQLILSGWLIWRLHYVWWSIAVTIIEFAAGVLSAIYLDPPHGFLFQTQVLFQLAFGTLLVLSLATISQGVGAQVRQR